MIRESFRLSASNTDILAAPSRLSAIPYNGTLTLEVSALECNGSNRNSITLQTPDGDVPFEDLLVPAGSVDGTVGTEDVLNSDTQLTFSFPARQGGHFLLSTTETGANILFIHATLTP